MTDTDRIKRLEIAVERLCDIIGRIERIANGFGIIGSLSTDIQLIKQYVSGKLEQQELKQ